jgi:hypothetical protein
MRQHVPVCRTIPSEEEIAIINKTILINHLKLCKKL